MKTATIQLETLTCPSCMQKIEGAIKNLDGVAKDTVNVMFNSSKVKLEFDEDKIALEDITNAIIKVGYEVKAQNPSRQRRCVLSGRTFHVLRSAKRDW